MDTIISNESSIAHQFCTFCLREKHPGMEFFKRIAGCSEEQQKCLRSVLNYDFRMQNFAICQPCWKIMQLVQDFRLRCLKANLLVERIGKGVKSEDGWFSAKNVATIESVRLKVKDQLLQMEQLEGEAEKSRQPEGAQRLNGAQEPSEEGLISMLDVGEVKVEADGAGNARDMPMVTIYPVQIKTEPDAGKEPNGSHSLKQLTGTRDTSEEGLLSTLDIDEVKAESNVPDRETSTEAPITKSLLIQNVQIKSEPEDGNTADEVLESAIDIGEVKIESTVEDGVQSSSTQFEKMVTESEGESSEHSRATSRQLDNLVLFQCTKCGRMFEPTGYKIHIQICDGKLPEKLYKCSLCPVTFTHLYKLTAHVNKHTGETPFECRQKCRTKFASAAVRNRHEIRCGEDFKKCTLCDKILVNQMRLYEHYRLEHPGERRFACSHCDQRYKKKEQLIRHERTHAPPDVGRNFICNICNKTFAEKYNMKKHMTTHADRKPIPCEYCDKQFKLRESLELHKAGKHPEQATESAKKNLARMKKRYLEMSLQKRMEPRVLKKRGPKPKAKKREPESESESETESETEIPNAGSEESDTQ